MMTQEITQKWLAVLWHGKVVEFLTPEEAIKKVKDSPQSHKLVKDEKTGKYVLVVCT